MQRYLGSMEKMISSLTWLAFKTWLKKVWAWCKKNWKLFVGAAIPITIMIITRRSGDISKILERISGDYQKEIEAIESAREKEILSREEAQKRYFDSLEEIESEYEKRKEKLVDGKRKEIEKILKDHDGNPEEITRRLALITGFEIYTPTND